VLDAAKAQHLEGVIAKRRDSRYEPGRRTDCWVKTKVVCRQDAVVGGWKPGAGGRTGSIGSLLLGVHDEPGGALRYIGHAGSGLTGAVLEALRTTLPELARETSPFADPPGVPREHARDARWVEPVLVADVQFSSWTKDDRLRHPVFKGLRMDVDPAEVIRES
jgi:bifunctional non-homologous end joining protein LigD